jgi:hypothetical protein
LCDLQPYVCTFKGCSARLFSSRHEWFDHELVTHRKFWGCDNCNKSFETVQAFTKHLDICLHGALLTGTRLKSIIVRCEKSFQTIPPSNCPLCNDWSMMLRKSNPGSVVALEEFEKHLGRHLEKLALFALPRLETEEGDEADVCSNAAVADDLKSERRPIVSHLYDIDDSAQDTEEFTSNPLYNCARKGDLAAVMSLIESTDNKPTEAEVDKAALAAASACHIDVLKYLLPSCSIVGVVLILQAGSKNGQMAVVKALATRKDLNIDEPDNTGQTPLATAATENNVEMVKLLLEMGADAGRGYHIVSTAPNGEAAQAILRLLLDQITSKPGGQLEDAVDAIKPSEHGSEGAEFPKTPLPTTRTVTYQTGENYIGQWLQVSSTLGYPHGYGQKYSADEYYEGHWFKGLRHGNGIRTLSSGEQYNGTWKENKRHGFGKQTYIDGTEYEGGWNEDVEYGFGRKTRPNGEVYLGGFCNGKEMGFAAREHPDGRKYNGGIKNNQPNGYGVGTFKDGRKMDGGWKDGKAHGWGTETVGTLKHVGSFVNGFWEGPGEQTYDRKVVKGEWKKGKVVYHSDQEKDEQKK